MHNNSEAEATRILSAYRLSIDFCPRSATNFSESAACSKSIAAPMSDLCNSSFFRCNWFQPFFSYPEQCWLGKKKIPKVKKVGKMLPETCFVFTLDDCCFCLIVQ